MMSVAGGRETSNASASTGPTIAPTTVIPSAPHAGQATASVQDVAARQRAELVQLSATVQPDSPEERVVEALFDCIARWGMSKTTVEDVARSAGMSRATLYRLFPGGKTAILQVGLASEVTRLVADLREQLDELGDLASVLARAISFTTTELRSRQALGFVRAHEWETVEKYMAFDRLDPIFLLAGAAFGPSLMRFLPPEEASHVAMWGARVVVSYLQSPSDEVDPGDEATAHRLVTTYLLPGLRSAA